MKRDRGLTYAGARARRGAETLGLAASIVLALLAASPGQASAARLPSGPSTAISLPANASSESTYRAGGFASLACPTTGPCVAVGDYIATPLSARAMAVSQMGETWGRAVEVTPPENASESPFAGLDSVACPKDDYCTAIGHYRDATGVQREMAVNEAGGVWGTAVEISGVRLYSIACSAPGSCVAIGASDSTHLVGIGETGGVWGQPQPIALPANAAPNYVVEPLPAACHVSGTCFVAANYTDASIHQRLLEASASNGQWGQAHEIGAAPGAEGNPRLQSLACPALEPCVAVGDDGQSAIGAAESGDGWGSATLVAPPTRSPAVLLADVFSVACPASGRCVGVGYDEPDSHSASAIVFDSVNGAFTQASEVSPPAAGSPVTNAQLRHVACASSGSCLAIGFYSDGERVKAMAASESDGEWAQADQIAAPPTAPAAPVELELVACHQSGDCVALGEYADGAAGKHPMAAGVAVAPAPLRPSNTVVGRLTVRRVSRTGITLACRGPQRCKGRARLTVRVRVRHGSRRARVRTIAAFGFALAAGATRTTPFAFNAAGRALLHSAHEPLQATLSIFELAPVRSSVFHGRVRVERRQLRHRGAASIRRGGGRKHV